MASEELKARVAQGRFCRKHYVALAAWVVSEELSDWLRDSLGEMLKRDNPTFDEEKWKKACSPEE